MSERSSRKQNGGLFCLPYLWMRYSVFQSRNILAWLMGHSSESIRIWWIISNAISCTYTYQTFLVTPGSYKPLLSRGNGDPLTCATLPSREPRVQGYGHNTAENMRNIRLWTAPCSSSDSVFVLWALSLHMGSIRLGKKNRAYSLDWCPNRTKFSRIIR